MCPQERPQATERWFAIFPFFLGPVWTFQLYTQSNSVLFRIALSMLVFNMFSAFFLRFKSNDFGLVSGLFTAFPVLCVHRAQRGGEFMGRTQAVRCLLYICAASLHSSQGKRKPFCPGATGKDPKKALNGSFHRGFFHCADS